MKDPVDKIPEYLIPQKYPKNEMKGKMDYSESANVAKLHGAVYREKDEPGYIAQNKALPGWLIAIFAALLFWSGSYLSLFSGAFRNDIFNDEDTVASMYFPRAGQGGGQTKEVEKTMAQLGKGYYTNNCQSCHQAAGSGVAGQYPPLAGSEWVLGSERRLGMILLFGLQGPVHVKGAVFNNQMPPWGASLSDKKIAAVLTYIRSEWGNKAPEVSEAGIAALRKELGPKSESWTEADLLKVPEGAPLPGAAAAKP